MRTAAAAPADGPQEERFKDGKLKARGHYVAGELDGEWTWWRTGGGVQTGAFTNGVQTGPWRRWHDNGQLLDEGSYVAGKKTGLWKTYDRSGKVIREATLKSR